MHNPREFSCPNFESVHSTEAIFHHSCNELERRRTVDKTNTVVDYPFSCSSQAPVDCLGNTHLVTRMPMATKSPHLITRGAEETKKRRIEIEILRVSLLQLLHPDIDDLSVRQPRAGGSDLRIGSPNSVMTKPFRGDSKRREARGHLDPASQILERLDNVRSVTAVSDWPKTVHKNAQNAKRKNTKQGAAQNKTKKCPENERENAGNSGCRT